MVTQAPRKTAVLGALAFTMSCIALMVFVWLQFHGTVPFSPQGYEFRTVFTETGLLVPGADVRISGVTVGRVVSVKARGLSSDVTMEIDNQYAPIPSDTRAILRQKTLLGEAFVALSTGSRAAPKLADGGTLPASQVQHSQALDQVLASFDRPTQRNLQAVLSGTYAALAGRGEDLNNAFGNLDPTLVDLSAIVGALNDQNGNVRSVIANSATVLRTLGSRSAAVQSLVQAGDAVLSSTAQRNRELTATVSALPPFLSQLHTSLPELNRTLGLAKPALDALSPVAPLLTPALADLISLAGPAVSLLHEAPPLLHDASVALPAITRFDDAFRPAVDALLPAARELAPVISYVGLYSREIVAAMANLAADLEATAAANVSGGKTNYLRAISMITNESLYGQSVREPTLRTNAYYAPGELSNLAHGLLSASCANTADPAQVPGGRNVPCRVQPPVDWGHGWASAYFPHVTRAKVPSR